MATKIAEGFVEVSARVDRDKTRKSANDAAKQAGNRFATSFGDATNRGMSSQRRNLNRSFSTAGSDAGASFTTAATNRLRDERGRFVSASRANATAAGRAGGQGYSSGFGRAAGDNLGSELDRSTSRTLRDQNGRFTSSGREGGQGFTRGFGMGAAGFGAALNPVVAAVGVAGGAIAGTILTTAKDFEAAMNNVRAVTGVTGEDFEELSGLAREMGSTTSFSASEAADAMGFLGMAGFDTNQIMEALPETLNLAAAGGIELAQAADIASNVLTGFGLEAEEMGRVSDAMAEAASSSNTNIAQLGGAFEQVGPVAKSAGLSFEETTAALGLLANAGLQGEKGGTALRGALAALANASGPAQEELDRLGIQAMNADGSMRPLVDIVRDFEDAGLDMATAVKIFGTEAAPGMLAMVDQGSDALSEMTGELEGAEGAAEDMAAIKMEGLAGQLKTLRSAVEGAMLAFADMGLLTGATKVVEFLATGVQKLTAFMEDHGEKIKPVIQGIGLFVGIAGALAGILIGAKLAIAGIGAALAVVISPVGLVVAAIAALATGLILAWKNSERFREIVMTLWERIKAGAQTVVAFFQDQVWPVLVELWGQIRDAAEPVVDRVREFFQQLQDDSGGFMEKIGEVREFISEAMEGIKGIFSRVWEVISGIWSEHGDTILSVIMLTISNMVSIISGAWEIIKGITAGLWSAISGIFMGAIQVITGILDFFIGLFTGDWARMWEGIKGIFGGIWTAITGIFTGAVQIVIGIVKGLWTAIKGVFMNLWNWLVGNSLIPDLVNAVIMWFTTLWTKAVNLFNALKNGILARVMALKDRAIAFVLALKDRFVAIVTALWNAQIALFNAIRSAIVARVQALRDMVVSRVMTLRDRFMSTVVNLRDRARAIFDNIRDWLVSRATTLKNKVASAVDTLKSRMITAFEKAKDGIKKVWDKLKKVAAKPVNFVIESVYTDGVKKVWDGVANKIDGVGTLPTINPIAFRTGGIADLTEGAALPGFSSKDNILAQVRSGEGVLVPEAVRSLGSNFIHKANSLKGRAGQLLTDGIPGFQFGGIVGDFLGAAGGFFSDGLQKALNAVLNPIKETLRDKFGESGFKGLPVKAMIHMMNKMSAFIMDFKDMLEGGDGGQVVNVARDQVGISGRPNKFTRAPGMWTDEWCGMFVDWVFKKANAFNALDGVNGTPAVRNYTSLQKVSQNAKRPGDLALYRGDAGHINIVTDPATGETVGGNESNSVRKQFGYVNSASSIRRPKFARGGIVDARDVEKAGGLENLRAIVGQDHVETPFPRSDTRERRDLFAPLPGQQSSPRFMAGTRDVGGIFPNNSMVANTSGQAEVVQTLDQIKAMAEAGKGKTFIFKEGSVVVDASKIKDIQDFLDMIERVHSTSRQFGSRITRTNVI